MEATDKIDKIAYGTIQNKLLDRILTEENISYYTRGNRKKEEEVNMSRKYKLTVLTADISRLLEESNNGVDKSVILNTNFDNLKFVYYRLLS